METLRNTEADLRAATSTLDSSYNDFHGVPGTNILNSEVT